MRTLGTNSGDKRDRAPTLPARRAVAKLVAKRVRRPDSHPAAVYLAGLAPGSRRSMGSALERAARELTGGRVGVEGLEWGALRYQHLAALRGRLAETLAPSTVNRHIAAVKGALREAWRLGQLDAEAYARIRDVGGVKGKRLPAGRALTARERQKLYEACADGTASGRRDSAMLALLDGCGLRRSEAVALQLRDYDSEAAVLRIRAGKGNRERLAPIENGARDALDDFLAARGDTKGPLLCRVTKAGRVEPTKGITTHALYKRLRKRAEQAGVARFSPHDLRRTAVSDLLTAGADLAAVAAWAGHASIATTQRYDLRGEDAKRKAARLRSVPYQRPDDAQK